MAFECSEINLPPSKIMKSCKKKNGGNYLLGQIYKYGLMLFTVCHLANYLLRTWWSIKKDET